MTRQVNAAGIALLERLEGCRLYTYDDATGLRVDAGETATGHLTAGVGHTGADVIAGMVVTQSLCDSWCARDLAAAAADVELRVTVPLGDNEFAALVIFRFNVGTGNFRASALLRKLNAGNYPAVPAEMARWNIVTTDGRKTVSKGLTARRAAEAALFTTPDHIDPPVYTPGDDVGLAPLGIPVPPSLIERVHAWLFGTSVPAYAATSACVALLSLTACAPAPACIQPAYGAPYAAVTDPADRDMLILNGEQTAFFAGVGCGYRAGVASRRLEIELP